MNPREFCRLPDHDFALCFTYSFSPEFFERVIARDLWVGGARVVVVVADAEQVAKSLERVRGQVSHLNHLGRKYHLATASTRGAFHPKMILRVGDEGALCWIGSGNFTSSGWLGLDRGNRELATCFRIDGDSVDGRAFVLDLLDLACSFTSPSYTRKVLDGARDRLWLRADRGDPTYQGNILWSRDDDPLASQLAQRWNGRRFRQLRVITGSSDDKGAMLKWAVETFGVTDIQIALDPSRASFGPKALSRLKARVRFHPLTGRPTHAKFYWFEGPNGAAAVMGSANCSAAAWLVPPSRGVTSRRWWSTTAPRAAVSQRCWNSSLGRAETRTTCAAQAETMIMTTAMAQPRGSGSKS